MEKRQYYFAGIGIEIIMPQEKFYKDEYRLAAFRTKELKNPHVMEFQWVDKLSEPVGNLVNKGVSTLIYHNNQEQIRYLSVHEDKWECASIRVSHNGKKHMVEVVKAAFSDRITVKTVLECMSVEHLIAGLNGVILHSSFIAVKEKGILFTAPSGTGKSTQAELWRNLRNVEIINGDRTAVRWNDDTLFAEGIPFAGSSQYCLNRSMPLLAIVYLAQAPVTSIRRLHGYEAFSYIWKECSMNTWDRQDVEWLSNMIMQVIKKIPIFYLACTPDESAIIELEKALMESEGVR